jgi:hypothetical protein
VLLPGVVAESVSILLLLVNDETVDVDKMLSDNETKKLIVVFWSLRTRFPPLASRSLPPHTAKEEDSSVAL